MMFRFSNCVNGTLASQITQKKIFQTKQPVKFQWKNFLLLMITEIDFFSYLARFTRKNARLERISGSASATTQPRDLWKCFPLKLSKNIKWKYRWNFEKCLSWAVYAIFSTKISEMKMNRRYRNSWKRNECCWLIATFVVHKLNSMSIVKTQWEIEVKKINLFAQSMNWTF